MWTERGGFHVTVMLWCHITSLLVCFCFSFIHVKECCHQTWLTPAAFFSPIRLWMRVLPQGRCFQLREYVSEKALQNITSARWQEMCTGNLQWMMLAGPFLSAQHCNVLLLMETNSVATQPNQIIQFPHSQEEAVQEFQHKFLMNETVGGQKRLISGNHHSLQTRPAFSVEFHHKPPQ